MSHARGHYDVAVVGSGVVGAAAALAFARSGRRVALIESRTPPRWQPENWDLRVYAIAPDNAALLAELGVWESVRSARIQAYRRMQVWDAAGGGELVFDADTAALPQLGFIIEHGLLVDRMWAALQGAATLYCPATVATITQNEAGATVQLEDGARLRTSLVVAADGATSPLRVMSGIATSVRDYGQSGLVAYVETESPHRDTCWQRFLSSGPLAILPFVDGCSSIVWTLPSAQAERLQQVDEAHFNHEVTRASDLRLGALRLHSERAVFPLRRLLTTCPVLARMVLIGDAAHVVHPLAGQGVNLGLRDVADLVHSIGNSVDPGNPTRLARHARRRRSEAAVAAYAFEGLNALFSNAHPLATLVRGPLLGLAGRLPGLRAALWRRAGGGQA